MKPTHFTPALGVFICVRPPLNASAYSFGTALIYPLSAFGCRPGGRQYLTAVPEGGAAPCSFS
jgi:hypothetical protein